jgi:hypothetical protein
MRPLCHIRTDLSMGFIAHKTQQNRLFMNILKPLFSYTLHLIDPFTMHSNHIFNKQCITIQ